MKHRPAPDDRRIVAGQKAHRDHLQAELLGRHDLLPVGRELAFHAEHDRHVGPVDIAVDDADAPAAFGERDREVDRDRCLADAARTRENISVVQSLVLDRIAQRARDRFLAGNFFKGLRAPFPGDNLIGHKKAVNRKQ